MNIEIITTQNKACESILNSINKIGYTTKLSICNTLKDLKDVVHRKPDLVLLAVKYITTENDDNIWLSEFFEKNNINYSGSSRETLKFDSDKVLAKLYLKDKGISTARFFTAVPGEYKRDNDLPINYPLFLKPSDSSVENSTDNLSFVNNFAEFESKVSSLYDLYQIPVLVEEYLDGQEFTVAIIKTKDDELLISSIEVIPPKSSGRLRVLGEKMKKDDIEKLVEIENNAVMNSVNKLAIDAYIDLGIRDFGQIDIKANKSGHCFFMQANMLPAITNGSGYFSQACKIKSMMSYDKVIKLIVDEGISRVTCTKAGTNTSLFG
ncbi:MAG: D-alanine--D-alanine ligase [Sulfurimonas sp.]|uniref:D-alanine--D-alanine ligase n=1 Tax=Sulfurimonas sp. TaxID=2022749 RepID=UPI002620CF01|nr:D-alanine--D-alanine ligase [Sulfurimonas sp.]MCW8895173.1 D-alanine--D-alanine ligase [Sulfurimonas sp.]MCW8954866.1 D-alanine--D-alanine ligase [Sulfurimonas sp.]MCW9068109.1 D-alanine--D-alanine ligase [Sulfurimonas sp.]